MRGALAAVSYDNMRTERPDRVVTTTGLHSCSTGFKCQHENWAATLRIIVVLLNTYGKELKNKLA